MPLDIDALERLAAFLPAFDAGFDFGTWRGGAPGVDGVIQMPWFELSAQAEDFLGAVRSAGWVQPFDWPAWAVTAEGQSLTRDPDRIGAASADDLSRALTALVRGNRFHDGLLAAAHDGGVLHAIVRRAARLAESDDLPLSPP